jgi:lysozyme
MTPAAELIAGFEGCRLEAYRDGGGVWTIGYGQTGPSIKPGLKWTQQQALDALEHTTAAVTDVVRSLVHVPLTANQLGAVVSLTYNIGTHALSGSTLLRKLNAGDYQGAADEFPKWNHDNGKVEAGLTNRRMAERALFLKA